jgi:hypothetical protein
MDDKTRKPWVNPKLTRLSSGSAEVGVNVHLDAATGHS